MHKVGSIRNQHPYVISLISTGLAKSCLQKIKIKIKTAQSCFITLVLLYGILIMEFLFQICKNTRWESAMTVIFPVCPHNLRT